MAYCGPKGIRYAEFLEWDDLSQSAAIAWQAREAHRCGSCGQVPDDWMTVDEDGNRVGVDDIAVVERYCPPCDRLARANEAKGKDPTPGVTLVIGGLPPAAD